MPTNEEIVKAIVHEIRRRADEALRDMVTLEKEGQDDNAMAAAAVGAALNNLAQTLDAPECGLLSRMPMYYTLVKERNELLGLLRYFGPYDHIPAADRTRLVDILAMWKEIKNGQAQASPPAGNVSG